MPLEPTYPLIPTFNFLGFVLALVPLPWMLQSWNVGAACFSLWTALSCLDIFINTVIWRDSFFPSYPIFCDISVHFKLAAIIGVPLCSLTINRRLFLITRQKQVAASRKERIRSTLIDVLLCVFVPLLFLPLAYIVQYYRYDVIEQEGCEFSYGVSAYSVAIVDVLPLFPSLVSILYAPFVIRAFLKMKRDLAEFCDSNCEISSNHYNRLIAISAIDIFTNLPFSIYQMIMDLIVEVSKYPDILKDWPGWKIAHSWIHEIGIGDASWRVNAINRASNYYSWWKNVVLAFAFFFLFGTSKDMRTKYRTLVYKCLRSMGLRLGQPSKKETILPSMDFQPGLAPVTMEPTSGRNRRITTTMLLASDSEAGVELAQSGSPSVGDDEGTSRSSVVTGSESTREKVSTAIEKGTEDTTDASF